MKIQVITHLDPNTAIIDISDISFRQKIIWPDLKLSPDERIQKIVDSIKEEFFPLIEYKLKKFLKDGIN